MLLPKKSRLSIPSLTASPVGNDKSTITRRSIEFFFWRVIRGEHLVHGSKGGLLKGPTIAPCLSSVVINLAICWGYWVAEG